MIIHFVIKVLVRYRAIYLYVPRAYTTITMAKSRDSDDTKVMFCDPCQFDKEQTIAIGYCEECKEYLCKMCTQAHRKVTATREHVVKEDENQCENGETCLHEKCLLHEDQVIDHYCVLHKEVCCKSCLSTAHRSCQESDAVKNIPDYVKTINMGKELEDFKAEMNNLVADVGDTMHLVQTSVRAIELNYDLARSEMLKLKTSAIAHIEEIYNKLDEELNNLMTTDLTRTLLYKKKCDVIRFGLDAVDSYMQGKLVDNNKQLLFLAIKNAILKINSSRIDLEKLRHKKVSNITRYKFKASAAVNELKTVSSFGTFDTENSAFKTVKHEKTFNVHTDNEEVKCCISGLAVYSKGTIVVTDKNNKSVKLIDVEEERVVSKVSLESAPWDVTVVSGNQIAVTIPDIGAVHILSVSENRTLHNLIDRKINVSQECCGIKFAKEKLYITIRNPPKLVVYNMNGELVSSVELNMLSPEYITTNKSTIFISGKGGYIRGMGFKEFDIDDFKEKGALSDYDQTFGMALDKTGVLYFCSFKWIRAVCIVERYGCDRKFKDLIYHIGGQPKCLAFDDETNRLFVGNDSSAVAVYYVV